MPHKQKASDTPIEIVNLAPTQSKGFTESTPLALLLSPSSQSSDDYDHTSMMDDDGLAVGLDELIKVTTTSSRVTTPVEVKPLPKIRLDLCPVPREEDEEKENDDEDDDNETDDQQQLKQIYSSPSTNSYATPISNSARTKSIGSSSRAQWHTIDSIDQDMYPLGGLVGRGRSQKSEPISEVFTFQSDNKKKYDDIISKAAQDSRERSNKNSANRRRSRDGFRPSRRPRLLMCGAGGINLNDKEVKDSIQDVKTTLRQIFTTNLETLSVIKKSVHEAYLHYYYHNSMNKTASNGGGGQKGKDEYFYMHNNDKSKTMSMSTVNDEDDDKSGSYHHAKEKVMKHENTYSDTRRLEFEEEQFEPVEFDVRRLV